MTNGQGNSESQLDILVVDDEPYLPDLVVSLLARAGYRVTSAPSAEEALTLLQSLRPRLLVTDHFLGSGRLSGLDLIRQAVGAAGGGAVVRDAAQPGLICVVVTACFDPDLLDSLAAEAGVRAVLRKPFDMRRLCKLVEELIGAPSRLEGRCPEVGGSRGSGEECDVA